MKACIITYSSAVNYGAILQTYGLYKVLQNNHVETTVIDYVPERYDYDSIDYKEKLIKSSLRWKKIPIVRRLWADKILKESILNRIVFRDFLEKNIPLTKKYRSSAELRNDLPLADVYITGSDQVWNSDFLWSGIIDGPFYFDFLPNYCRRISYASSFGKNKLNEKEVYYVKKYLEKYSAISVREKSGVKLLSDIGIKADEVLDPTLLAGKECFKQLIPSRLLEKKTFFLLFQIKYDKKLYEIANLIAKKNGMTLITIFPSFHNSQKCKGKKIVLPAIEDWLWYFYNAEFIITDSFHATAFSIMFNKQFVSSGFAYLNGRITNLLEITNLQNRLLTSYDCHNLLELFNNKIDYKDVNDRIEICRNFSLNWLMGSIR